ncbi:MAG: helix-turn-helix domain-containing protein [Planctomycetes bacterium]|nr:helix-turn-helix domain-containing protein [Planctomycetota bacterium]
MPPTDRPPITANGAAPVPADPPATATGPPPVPAPAPEPLLVPAPEAARLCGVSEATWWRLVAAGKTPSPVRLGHSTRWRVAELKRWVQAGCPDRKAWQALEASRR